VPARGRLPRPEAAAGLGGVPCLDAVAGVADDADALRGARRAAPAGVGAQRAVRGRLVAAPALEPAQGACQCAGGGGAAVAGPRGNPATSLGMAGRGGNIGARPGTEGGYVRWGSAPVGQTRA